ncbi:hypothetical protein FBY40_1599 [Microbacterium sp. SLBN-154]|uniref:hypothetical protein n=1 Tax=Microbacterium sp. SLBN-154 TaxID=2768458 RepID=UPI0011528779|nr:hypothetical protein [Microbacterium sp. SLBN-154]TQK19108.1 hypothetical protein FBY40_1599 [Microbacterium sp. SLBN-154]
MPATTPLDPQIRHRIAADIRVGLGRNAIARAHGVSGGTVSKIARQEGICFRDAERTASASAARQIDQAVSRARRARTLWEAFLDAPNRPDGTDTSRLRRASYALYNLDRHHNGRYPSP